MNPTLDESPIDPKLLERWADTRPSQTQVEAAQRRLLERLAAAAPKPARPASSAVPAPRWRAGFAIAAALMVAVLLYALPTLTPHGSVAFAQVQQFLASYRSVAMQAEARSGEQRLWTLDVAAERNGRTRVDMSGMSLLVDPAQGRVLTLMHGPRQWFSAPIDASQGEGSPDDGLDWLAKLEQFRGEAQTLDERRVIDGIPATGFALDIESLHVELWAADDDGRPLRMAVDGGLHIDYRFSFDSPDIAQRLSMTPPSDYQQVPAQDG